MGEKIFKLGPKVMKGTIWDQKGSSRIMEILISHQQDSINSIQFTYFSDGEIMPSKIFGNLGGLKFNTVSLDYGEEFLVSVSGEYDKDGKLVSIVFGTNKRKYGPFGRTSGSGADNSHLYDEFNYEFGPRNCFGGFHGSVYNGSVHAVGVYVTSYYLAKRRWINFI